MAISSIKRNFMIIFLTLMSTLIFLFILKWLLEATIEFIEKFLSFITYKLILKIKWRYLLVFYEINILITPIFLLIILRKYLGDLSLFVYLLFLLILGSITFYVRKERGNMVSLIDTITTKINTNNYFVNRINLLFEQGLSIMILIGALEFTILTLTELEWPTPLKYISFLALPIYLNIWIYFSYKFKLKDTTTINIRRIIVYILLAVYVLKDSYSKFYLMLYYNTSPELDLFNLFVYIGSGSFIALERVIKSIIDDFKYFRPINKINENN